MARIRTPEKAKVFCGIIYREENVFIDASARLTDYFGSIQAETRPIIFRNTDYYTEEMGSGLKRRLICFKGLKILENIAGWKIFTNRIEMDFLAPGTDKRMINIDPGYLNLARVVLLSAKDFSHRIHIGGGIYAEVTLLFRGKEFTGLPWTYPDYKLGEYIEFFKHTRDILKTEMGG